MDTPTPHFTLGDTALAPDAGIWFALPAGFTRIPLEAFTAAPGSPEADRLGEGLAPLLNAMDNEAARRRLTSTLAATQHVLRALHSEGTVHCALGVHRDDTGAGPGDGLPLLSQFTITWVDTAWAPRGVTAARAVAAPDGHAHIDYVDLPCGPASFNEVVRTPTPESGLPHTPLLQLSAHLPHPDSTCMAVLMLNTTAVSHADEYRAMLRDIAGTVTFENPFAAESAGVPSPRAASPDPHNSKG